MVKVIESKEHHRQINISDLIKIRRRRTPVVV
jgi:hypothetical protein